MYEIGRHYLRGQSVRRLGKMSNRQQAELSDTDCRAAAVAHSSFVGGIENLLGSRAKIEMKRQGESR